MQSPKRPREIIPRWWFALAPGQRMEFWVRVAWECKAQKVSKNSRDGVTEIVKVMKRKSK